MGQSIYDDVGCAHDGTTLTWMNSTHPWTVAFLFASQAMYSLGTTEFLPSLNSSCDFYRESVTRYGQSGNYHA
jgi:hypothetical protein